MEFYSREATSSRWHGRGNGPCYESRTVVSLTSDRVEGRRLLAVISSISDRSALSLRDDFRWR